MGRSSGGGSCMGCGLTKSRRLLLQSRLLLLLDRLLLLLLSRLLQLRMLLLCCGCCSCG